MPRSLLEILLEKKDPKKSLLYPTQGQFNAELKNLDEICTRTLTELFGIEGFGGVNTFEEIRTSLKDCQAILRKFKEEYQDYPWEDPTVQNKLSEQRKIIMGDKPNEIGGLLLDLQEARIESLGEGDSYRIANSYFETAESLRVSGTQRILKVASMRDKEIKVDRARSNTDITENNEIDNKKYDITAKKIPEGEKPKDMSDDDWTKRKAEIAADNKKRKEEVARLRMGIFSYLGMIVGETQADVKEKWGGEIDKNGDPLDPDATQRAYREQLLVKAMPFIEKVTQQDFNEKDPINDKKYMNFLMILASYSPGYKNYKPDPKEELVDNKITDEQKEVIGVEMTARKGEIEALIDKIKARHPGGGIDKIITEEMEKAQADLKSVDAKTACDIDSKRKLLKAKVDLDQKVKDNGKVLKPEDIEDLGKVADIIDLIFEYCNGEKYIVKKDKK
jgi:hypothetical protein